MGKRKDELKKAQELEAKEKREKKNAEANEAFQKAAQVNFERIHKEKQELLDMKLRKWAVEQSIAWRAATNSETQSFAIAECYYNYAKTGRKLRL